MTLPHCWSFVREIYRSAGPRRKENGNIRLSKRHTYKQKNCHLRFCHKNTMKNKQIQGETKIGWSTCHFPIVGTDVIIMMSGWRMLIPKKDRMPITYYSHKSKLLPLDIWQIAHYRDRILKYLAACHCDFDVKYNPQWFHFGCRDIQRLV